MPWRSSYFGVARGDPAVAHAGLDPFIRFRNARVARGDPAVAHMAAELFRLPLPTSGTLFQHKPSQLLRCSRLSFI